MALLPSAPGTTLSRITPGRIKASVFEVDPKGSIEECSRNIGESEHFTSRLRTFVYSGENRIRTAKAGARAPSWGP